MKLLGSLKEFWEECKRVLKVTKKPDRQELSMVVKVTGLGMLIIGMVGFLITLLNKFLLS
ncbi:MAG: protein translocase SEC61 complex subunit gamma [Nanoarchaeota archaeon]|nr:protein translocase SEC61 complex subunit gamma [Nanoarchaeota archaeon]